METIRFGGRRVAGFGVGGIFGPDHPIEEVQALIKLYDARMSELDSAVRSFGTWGINDPIAYAAFLSDYAALSARYAVAKAAADAALLKLDPDAAYTLISKAMRQCYPPDGCRETKGDWADLFTRITTAQKSAGVPETADNPPTDLASTQSNDWLMKVYKATAPYDVIAQLTHEEASKLPAIQESLDMLAWLEKHKTAVAVGATVVGGALVYALVRR